VVIGGKQLGGRVLLLPFVANGAEINEGRTSLPLALYHQGKRVVVDASAHDPHALYRSPVLGEGVVYHELAFHKWYRPSVGGEHGCLLGGIG
jgi:hypothetical protein